MILATVCSGIGAPDLAAEKLGWSTAFQAEIEKFPQAVLKRHFKPRRFYEDFTQISTRDWLDGLDCLVAGTPCQDFSHAGHRVGIKGDRGNLTIEFIRLVQETNCKWGVIENVPGLLTNDFGYVLNAITGRDDLHRWKHWPNAGMLERGDSGYSACWRVLDAQFFGVPQRRRRVFIVFSIGDGTGPAAVLFDGEGGQRHTKEGRSQRARVAAGFQSRPGAIRQGELTVHTITGNIVGRDPKHGGNQMGIGGDISPTITSTDRHGVLTYEHHIQAARVKEITIAPSLPALMGDRKRNVPLVLANDQARATLTEDLVPTILSTQKDGPKPIVLSGGQGNATHNEDKAPALSASQYKDKPIVKSGPVLRYLTPTEIERCFGFPDGWTDISGEAEGKRYRALGNSMAVPVIRWVLERVERQVRKEFVR